MFDKKKPDVEKPTVVPPIQRGILFRLKERMKALEVQLTEQRSHVADTLNDIKTLAGEIAWLEHEPEAQRVLEEIERTRLKS